MIYYGCITTKANTQQNQPPLPSTRRQTRKSPWPDAYRLTEATEISVARDQCVKLV